MATKHSSKQPDINYQALQAELAEVVNDLQREALPLDEALKLYERGNILIAQLEEYLKVAELTIAKLRRQSEID